MIGIGISGGAFYLRAQARAVYELLKDKNGPKIYIGTSAGAVISAVAAVCGVAKMWEYAQNINPADAIKNAPYTKSGKMKMMAKLRVLFGCAPVKQTVIPILKSLITKREWDVWRCNRYKSHAVITTCNVETGVKHVWDLSHHDRDTAFMLIEASARMQGMTEPVNIFGQLHWDGGQFDHNPTYLLNDLKFKYDHIYSVWSRPDDWNAEDVNLKDANYLQLLTRMIELDNIEKSINDEIILRAKCQTANIPLTQVYIPRVLSHVYDSSEEGQNKAVQAAIEAVNQAKKETWH